MRARPTDARRSTLPAGENESSDGARMRRVVRRSTDADDAGVGTNARPRMRRRRDGLNAMERLETDERIYDESYRGTTERGRRRTTRWMDDANVARGVPRMRDRARANSIQSPTRIRCDAPRSFRRSAAFRLVSRCASSSMRACVCVATIESAIERRRWRRRRCARRRGRRQGGTAGGGCASGRGCGGRRRGCGERAETRENWYVVYFFCVCFFVW